MSRSIKQNYETYRNPTKRVISLEEKLVVTPPEEVIVFKVGEGVVIEEVKPLEIKAIERDTLTEP